MSAAPLALLVAYGGGHIAMVLPVVRELQARGFRTEVLALTTAGAAARRAGVPARGYADFLHLVDRERVLARGRELAQGNTHPEVPELETQAYLGINYCEWEDTLGPQQAAQRYAERGRHGFHPVRFLGQVIEALRPDVVVATNSPRSEQAAIEAAAQRGIPTVSMVDLFALDYDPYLRRSVHADRITVLGDAVRERLVAAGIDAARIRVTGNPAFDALVHPDNLARGRALRAALGWNGLTVVLWAGHLEGGADTPQHWRDEKFGVLVERELRAWVARQPRAALIVRYHPNEFPRFPAQAPQARVHVSDPRTEPVAAAVLAADAVVVQTTTVGLEAAVAGRSVFSLSFSPFVRTSGLDYATLGLAHRVESLGELVPMLERHGHTPAAACGQFHAGQAAEAIAAEIAGLLRAG